MSTNGLIHVVDEHGILLCTINKHCDGDPDGLGELIRDILNEGDVRIVQGFGWDDRVPEAFNGMGCLAAYLISELKEDIGDIYMERPNIKSRGDYTYILKQDGKDVHITSFDGDEELYDGLLEKFV